MVERDRIRRVEPDHDVGPGLRHCARQRRVAAEVACRKVQRVVGRTGSWPVKLSIVSAPKWPPNSEEIATPGADRPRRPALAGGVRGRDGSGAAPSAAGRSPPAHPPRTRPVRFWQGVAALPALVAAVKLGETERRALVTGAEFAPSLRRPARSASGRTCRATLQDQAAA